MPLKKVLIANRGEIAVRIARAAGELGYATVAIYNDSDARSPHLAACQEAVRVGDADLATSYLSIEAVISAAQRVGADAIHPGYGFLSENAEFARACAAAGICFVGPPADAIDLLGNKRLAKRVAREVGVPCIAGYDGDQQTIDVFRGEAARIGYPIMLKATAGGGGRGLRKVGDESELEVAMLELASESVKGPSEHSVIVEQALSGARHIEVQILADQHGHIVYFPERECSLQRRHQKLIEESPSTAVGAKLRAQLGADAIKMAQACGYQGAGTVEFLLDDAGQHHFLEMNPRLQVEHGVTEMVSGVDLVAWQFRIAEGQVLDLEQSQVAGSGHAIEARLCAEDPSHDFAPATGSVLRWQPASFPSLRTDHAIDEGLVIGTDFDPLLAKLIVFGDTREEARRRLVAALDETTLLGVTSNKVFLKELLQHPHFERGELSTELVSSLDDELKSRAQPQLVLEDAALVALLICLHACAASGHDASFLAWRPMSPVWSTVRLRCCDADIEVRLQRSGTGPADFDVTAVRDMNEAESAPVLIELIDHDDTQLITFIEGVRRRSRYARAGGAWWLQHGGRTSVWRDISHVREEAAGPAADGDVYAPLDGRVYELAVSVGDTVSEGQLLMVIEAMKMHHRIVSSVVGRVVAAKVSVGDQVARGELLLQIAQDEEVRA